MGTPLDLIPVHRLEYEPPGLCRFGPEFLAAIGLGAGEAAAGAAALAIPEAGVTAGGALASALTPAAAASTAGIALPSFSTLGTAASLGGTLISAKGQADQAAYQAALARSEAAALQQRANEEAASAQRRQITELRKAQLVGSRARALAAASGTLATDPTQLDIESDIAGQGEFNALSALFEGMTAAQSSRYQADIDLFRARRIRAAAPWAIGGTALSGLSSFAAARRSSRLLDLFG